LLGQDFGGQMQAMFEKRLVSSKAITLKDSKKRSLLLCIKQAAARLWVCLL
jgi:cardiolipin synthase